MKHLKKTGEAVEKYFRAIGPRPDYLNKLNFKERESSVRKALDELVSALRYDFNFVEVELDNEQVYCKVVKEGDLFLLKSTFACMFTGKGGQAFLLNIRVNVREDLEFTGVLEFDRFDIKGDDTTPVLHSEFRDWPKFRKSLDQFFQSLDANGFRIKS